MRDIHDQPITRSDFIGLAVSLVGAIISVAVAIAVYLSNAGGGASPLWPLIRLMLLDWAVLGVFCFIASYLSFRLCSPGWMGAAWIITGTFIPLIVLGQISLGPIVLISFLLFLVSTALLAYPRHRNWLGDVGWLLLGVIANLGVLLLLIYLVNPALLRNLPI